MARTFSGNYDALVWVQDEVQKSLADALQALTEVVDSPENNNAIARCITEIHQVSGTMEMLSLQGAHLIATEMLASAIALRDKKIADILPAQDSLLKSLLLLANYLKLIGTSLQDHPLRLIATINELRETRGVAVLDEDELFKPSLSIQLPDEVSPAPNQSVPNIGVSLSKLSQIFQVSLLNWFKTNELASLQRMAKIVNYLRLSCIQERTIILWWTAEGVFEALLDNGIPATPATKIKVGSINQAIKLFSKHDENSFLSVFPKSLVHSLLVLVAHSTSDGRYVRSLKKAFNLIFFDAAQHQKIYSFSADVLSEVNSALLFQLNEIKEHTDRLALSDQYSPDIMNTIIEQLLSMSNTLELLEEQIVSVLLQNQAQDLQNLIDQQQALDDDQLMALANGLLHIEHLLQTGNRPASHDSSDYLQLQKSVITECQHELITVKETLSLLVDHPELSAQSLSEITSQLQLIAGSLSMLNLDEAAKLFENTIQQIDQTKAAQQAISPNELNLLAEIIAAADLYMDNVLHRGSKNYQLLQNAQNILDRFNQTGASHKSNLSQTITSVQHYINHQAESLANATEILDSAMSVETGVERYINRQKEKVTSTIEILEIAPSVETNVQRYINQQTTQALTDTTEKLELTTSVKTSVQRYIEQHADVIFNTIDTLNIASSVESGVQRYINQQKEKVTNVAEILDIAPSVETSVQRYINQHSEILNIASPVETSVQRYINQHAESVAEIPPMATTSLEISLEELIYDQEPITDLTSETSLTSQFAEGIDAEIAVIFIEEANEVLVELRRLLPKGDAAGNTEILAIIRRHFHTLKGSGYMAGATVIADLAKAVEYLLNKVLDGNLIASTQLTSLLSNCTQLIPDLLVHFTMGDMSPNDSATKLIQTATQLLDAESDLSEEDELQQIFNLEATQHIATFKDALNESISSFTINKELLRAAHSLKGCANIAQVIPVAKVATQLDQSLRERYKLGTVLNGPQRDIVASAIEGLDLYVEYIKAPKIHSEPDISPFVESLQRLLPTEEDKAEQQRLIDPDLLAVFIEETDELLSQYDEKIEQFKLKTDNFEIKTALKHTLATLRDNAQILELDTLSELYQLLIQLVQQADAENADHLMLLELGSEEINLQIESLLQNKPSPDITDFKQNLASNLYLSPQPPSFSTEPVVVRDELFIIPHDDPELLEAFTEECAELLSSSGEAIKRWINDHADQDAISQLLRELHTIKGGARLAGIIPIADLTHQIESLVFQVTESTIESNLVFFDLLQRSQDRLADMQQLLANRSNFSFADDLVTEIAAFSGQTASTSVQQIVEPESTQDMDASPPVADNNTPAHRHSDQIRVRADLLDFLSNFAGEVSISRDRVGQQNSAIKQQLAEMEGTLSRLQDQLRNLEIETETQILFRYDDEKLKQESEFDPLELDRFSMIQQLSRGLTESVSDMHEISQSLELLVQESDAILLQQSRLSTDLQQGLMNTRLVPFGGLVPRFERIIRQTNVELNKQSELIIHGANQELDRTIIDRIVAPIEHLIRNAIAHGIESADERRVAGKKEIGTLTLTISREGSEVLISLSDDGQGINLQKVRQKALDQKLIDPANMPRDEDLIQLILSSGFSTAENISQLAGRGVGMDVVSNEIRALKGQLSIRSVPGKSTTFNIRLPLTLSIIQALLVNTHDHQYAIPLAAVHAGDRIAVSVIKELLQQENEPQYEANGEHYRFLHLSNLLGLPLILPDDPKKQLPLLLFHSGDMHVALLVDAINSNREIVLKSAGEQLNRIDAITGATILGDGQVVFILDIPALVTTSDIQIANNDNETTLTLSEMQTLAHRTTIERSPLAMVVDDSITVRKASSNLLKRHGFDIMTARDGMDGVAQLNEQMPDIILLDVEMPRMDGFEFATFVRNTEQYKHIPIVMITSRTGAKHRTRGMNIGVNAYMGKPYQEIELVETMKSLLGTRYPHSDQ